MTRTSALLLFALALRAAAEPLPRVVVLATGGTIASRFDPAKGGIVTALTGADLVQAVLGLGKIARRGGAALKHPEHEHDARDLAPARGAGQRASGR